LYYKAKVNQNLYIRTEKIALSITIDFRYGTTVAVFFVLCAVAVLPAMSFIPVQAVKPYDSGFMHGCSDAKISDPTDRYINQPKQGPSFHTSKFMEGYNGAFDDCSDPARPFNADYDCTGESKGCHGLVYCDINDEGSCYDRYD
jgi:hypothetical protein